MILQRKACVMQVEHNMYKFLNLTKYNTQKLSSCIHIHECNSMTPNVEYFHNIYFPLFFFFFKSFGIIQLCKLTFLPRFLFSGAKTTKLPLKVKSQNSRTFSTGSQFHRQEQKAQQDRFCMHCRSYGFRCGGQQDCNIKNASCINDGPQGRGMKGYFELSLKNIDSWNSL